MLTCTLSVVVGSKSSGAYFALNEACYAISTGVTNSAVVASVDRCQSSEGVEGIAVSAVYVKPLRDALKDGNPVRAVIRAVETDYYSSFHEPEVSSEKMFENLIRTTYEKADLDPQQTDIVEVIVHIPVPTLRRHY